MAVTRSALRRALTGSVAAVLATAPLAACGGASKEATDPSADRAGHKMDEQAMSAELERFAAQGGGSIFELVHRGTH